MADADEAKKIADALAGMGQPPAPTGAPAAGQPARPRPAAPPQSSPPAPAPMPAKEQKPPQPSRPLRLSRPGAPERPAMPPSTGSYAARSAASSADSGDSADPLAHIVEDSSAPVGVPFYAQHAASRSSTTARAGSAPVRQSFFRTLFFRRTIIPVLLTMGLALPAIAVWWFLLDQDAPLKQAGPILPLTLLVVGAMLLLLAIANILVVRQQLKQSPQPLVR